MPLRRDRQALMSPIALLRSTCPARRPVGLVQSAAKLHYRRYFGIGVAVARSAEKTGSAVKTIILISLFPLVTGRLWPG
jgi:hypothetical protein